MRRAVLAGLVIGALLTAWVAAATWDDDRHDTATTTATTAAPAASRPADARGFLAAWRRSLTATYAVEERIERRLVDGRRVTSDVRLVQRPPDRLRIGSGTVTARLQGRQYGCTTGTDGKLGCQAGGPAPSYAKAVTDELAVLRPLVARATAPYRVARGRDPGCWTLVLRTRLLAPPYGEDATFCYDRATGAPRRAIVHRKEGTDTVTTVNLQTTVGPDDLQLPSPVP